MFFKYIIAGEQLSSQRVLRRHFDVQTHVFYIIVADRPDGSCRGSGAGNTLLKGEGIWTRSPLVCVWTLNSHTGGVSTTTTVQQQTVCSSSPFSESSISAVSVWFPGSAEGLKRAERCFRQKINTCLHIHQSRRETKWHNISHICCPGRLHEATHVLWVLLSSSASWHASFWEFTCLPGLFWLDSGGLNSLCGAGGASACGLLLLWKTTLEKVMGWSL